jgi:tetraprenyl-beta-curcumene synthase
MGGPASTLRAPVAFAAEGTREHGELPAKGALGSTVARYLVSVLPFVRRELERWGASAREIPDPALRFHATEGLAKRGNLEGAALFAVLAPRSRRRETIRALVAYQAAYNYLDKLAEQPSADARANGLQLHQALLVALDPTAAHEDYYALNPQCDDGGFLAALVDDCRTALATLPSLAAVGAPASAAAGRIAAFQSLNLSEAQGGTDGLERWARRQAPESLGLPWWQIAAAGGSSLEIFTLIAAGAHHETRQRDVDAIEAAYFPSICALHSLLDSLVDVAEDQHAGQRNLLSYHASSGEAAFAMGQLARRSCDACRQLPNEPRHRVILAAMVGYYLSDPRASTPYARPIAQSVAGAVGPLLPTALRLFRARRAMTHVAGRCSS